MSPRPRPSARRRLMTVAIVIAVLGGLGLANRPVVAYGADRYHDYRINQQSYKEKYGFWSQLPIPAKFKVNGIHAALLHTGKVLIVAGSGNKEKNFDAGDFRTVLWDPADDSFKLIATPSDLFCAGHAFLPDGNLVVAGGTKRYEVLGDKVTHAAGAMKIRNESPDGGPRTFPKGTQFESPDGLVFLSEDPVTVPAAKKIGEGEATKVVAAEVSVFVQAKEKGKASVVPKPTQFTIAGLSAKDSDNLYGQTEKLTLEKQDYFGDDTSYEFDVEAEKYVKTGKLNHARWYPTLAPLADGSMLAVSGLDDFGKMLPGQIEQYDVAAKKWVEKPKLQRVFPSYPALFLMKDGRLAYSGMNAGYGSATVGRTPGIWNLRNNTMQPITGLKDADQLETGASLLLAPAQDQKIMVLGGGGIGESPKSTRRTAVTDLDDAAPTWTPTADLPNPTRYLSAVLMPDDSVFTTGGSTGYRGKGKTDLLKAQTYYPDEDRFAAMADPTIGHNYHASALLLPDGRVITLGSDPLFDDKGGYKPGSFEQRIEIYTPPSLFKGARPEITGGPAVVQRGQIATFDTPDPANIGSARLIRPSSVTHVTDVEQRSLSLNLTPTASGVQLTIPTGAGLVPSGYYMLFLNDKNGVPSVARWVKVA